VCGPVETLVELMEAGLEAVGGSQTALAKAIGVSRPRVSRLLSNKPTEKGGRRYNLGIGPCYKLAALVGVDVKVALRLSKKDWLVDLMDEHQSDTGRRPLTTEQTSILQDFRAVNARRPRLAKRIRELLREAATDARSHRMVGDRRQKSR
jgi:hypothetical protein